MPKESSIVSSITRKAKAGGWFVYNVHGGHGATVGMPDLLLWRNGISAAFEVKQPGRKPSKLQQSVISRLQRVGGVNCEVVTSAQQAMEYLDDLPNDPRRRNREESP